MCTEEKVLCCCWWEGELIEFRTFLMCERARKKYSTQKREIFPREQWKCDEATQASKPDISSSEENTEKQRWKKMFNPLCAMRLPELNSGYCVRWRSFVERLTIVRMEKKKRRGKKSQHLRPSHTFLLQSFMDFINGGNKNSIQNVVLMMMIFSIEKFLDCWQFPVVRRLTFTHILRNKSYVKWHFYGTSKKIYPCSLDVKSLGISHLYACLVERSHDYRRHRRRCCRAT